MHPKLLLVSVGLLACSRVDMAGTLNPGANDDAVIIDDDGTDDEAPDDDATDDMGVAVKRDASVTPTSPDAGPSMTVDARVQNPAMPDARPAPLPDAMPSPPPDARPMPELGRGLIGAWSFEEPSGSDIARDTSSQLNDGRFVDLDSREARVDGRVGRAVSFHRGFIRVPPRDAVDALSTAITIAAWVYRENGEILQGILSRQQGSGFFEHYYLMLLEGRPRMLFNTHANGLALEAVDPVPLRTWVHLAATYDGETARLYVDGREVAREPRRLILAPDMTPLIIGGNVNAPGAPANEFFGGLLDEVRLYGRALDPAEVRALANP